MPHIPTREEARREAAAFRREVLDKIGALATAAFGLVAAPPFYPAEAYHQDYYTRNASQSYCRVVIAPKVAKARQKFAAKLKRA